jgi:hypothetical protein
MPHLQPTVRQLQPLSRRDHSAPIMRAQVATDAREAGTHPPDPTMSVPPRPHRRRWFAARTSPSS